MYIFDAFSSDSFYLFLATDIDKRENAIKSISASR